MTFLRSSCVLILMVSALKASTIISVQGDLVATSGLSLDPDQQLVASWTAGGAYTDVSISVNLSAPPGEYSGTAYLTDAIGPGTSLADQIATAPFVADITLVPPFQEVLTVFSGLTLGAGTYYLTLSSDASSDSGFAWDLTRLSPTITTAPDVTHNTDLSSYGNMQEPYAPSSVFSPPPFDAYSALEFTVSGTAVVSPVPESSSLIPLAFLFVLAGCRPAIIKARATSGDRDVLSRL